MSSNIDNLPSPDEIRAQSKSDGDISHLPAPSELGYKPMPDAGNTAQDFQDLSNGGLQGVTFGGADEIEGGVKALGDASLSGALQNPGNEYDKLVANYRKYQQLAQDQYDASQKRSPYLYGAGQIAGGILPAVLSGGASAAAEGAGLLGEAASVAPSLASKLGMAAVKAAPVGAAMGALGSHGALIGANPEQAGELAKDTAIGGTVGGVLGAGAEALGSAASGAKKAITGYLGGQVKESPLLSQLVEGNRLGKQNISTSKRSDLINVLGPKEIENTQSIMQKIQDADTMLGQKVGATIEEATVNGHTILVPKDLQDVADSLMDEFKKNPALSINKKAQDVFENIISNSYGGEIQPQEALVLRDQMDELLGRMKGDNSTMANFTRQHIQDFRKNVNSLLNDQIPGYRDASARFTEFRKNIPEIIIGKGVPADISGVRVGDLSKPDSKLFSGIQDIIQGSELPGSSTAQAKQTLGMLQKNIKSLENPEFSNQDILNHLGGSADDFLGEIRKASDISAVVKQATGVNPQEGAHTLAKGLALGSTTGRGKVLGVANWMGRASAALDKKPSTISANVFDLPNESLTALATHLSASEDPTIKSLADNILKGLQNGNNANKNAALFALMQNKDARASIYNMLPGTSSEQKPNQ